MEGIGVDSVRFPRLGGILPLGLGEELAVPRWMGQLAKAPRRLLASKDGDGQRLEWFYPGLLSLQAIALYRKDGPGLYFSADDSLAYRKSFALWGERDGTAGFEMIHLPEDPARRARYQPPYAAVIGTFRGDWITAAERYREWGTQQAWGRESRLQRGEVPDWIRNTALWVWNRGRSPGVLAPPATLQKELGLPVSVFWHWWHHGPYDTGFPDYLPPREGEEAFRHAVREAQDQGLHAIVYMNQRLWCLNTPSWSAEGAEWFAVRNPDGTIRTEVYNICDPQPCATMDIATSFWRDKYAGIAEEVVNGYGLDGIYMDQAVLSLMCYAPEHSHPIGGGNYWMEGFAKLAQDVRRRADDPVALGGEGGGESWMPELDLFLTLQVSWERYTEPGQGWETIPFFQAVYHPYGITYGSYSSLTFPPYDDLWPAEFAPADTLQLLDRKYRRQFYVEQARSFVWGMQPTIANFRASHLHERPDETAYLLRLARLRSRATDYLLHRTFLRPPPLEVPELEVNFSRVSIYAARRGGATEWRGRAPAALAGAWRAPNGNVAIVVATVSEEPLSLSLRIDPATYGLTGAGRVYRVDETHRTHIADFGSGILLVSLELPALGAAILEFERS